MFLKKILIGITKSSYPKEAKEYLDFLRKFPQDYSRRSKYHPLHQETLLKTSFLSKECIYPRW